MQNKTFDIYNNIFEMRGINEIKFDDLFASLRYQLRYYREDILTAPRYIYDGDATYFYNYDEVISAIADDKKRRDCAERGDVMTSIWTPLTSYLKFNDNKVASKNNYNIDRILKLLEDDEEQALKICKLTAYLSKYYLSRGNLLLLPDSVDKNGKRRLNPDKYSKSEDKLDQFLYKCFEEELFVYFDYKLENLVNWILSEHLECIFSNSSFEKTLTEIEDNAVEIIIERNDIIPENIHSLINKKDKLSFYNYNDLNENEWSIFFENLNKVIAYRNRVQFSSHLPLVWG